MRYDKNPHECERHTRRPTRTDRRSHRRAPLESVEVAPEPRAPSSPAVATDRRPRARSPSRTSRKIYWPADGYTKGDLFEYYRAISPWMLRTWRIAARHDPFPDGIDGKQFYQKDAPEFAPEWIETFRSGARTPA
jgi:bifunctional non-homologous end joining protein LigD